MRLRDIIRVGERDSRVNMHVIFAEDVPPEEIEENFLRRLDFTSESAPGAKDEKKALTKVNLESLGRRVKQDHEPFRSQGDLQAGMMQAVVSHEQITEVLEGNRTFEKRYLLLLASDEDLSKVSWDGQGYQSRKVLIQKSHMLFSANPGTREFGLGLRATSREAFEAEFSSLKPAFTAPTRIGSRTCSSSARTASSGSGRTQASTAWRSSSSGPRIGSSSAWSRPRSRG